MPKPMVKTICKAMMGMDARITQPGKFPLRSKKNINSELTIEKFKTELKTTTIGKMILGKLIFLSRFALSKNRF